MIEVNDKNYNVVIEKSDKPVLIDFFTPYCAPCKVMMPIVEELETENDDINFVKVNAFDEADIAKEYGVRAVPTFVYVKEGKQVASYSGSLSKEDLAAWIDDNEK